MFWYAGQLSEDCPKIEITDRGLLLADAVFDTALAYRGTVVFGQRHVDRLAQWLNVLGIEVSRSALEAPYAALSNQDYPVSIRITVTRGSGPRGIRPPASANPRIFASSAPLPSSFVSSPLRIVTTDIRRNSTSVTSRIKTSSYTDSVQAMRVAGANGYDDALFLNEHGNVACTTSGNVLVCKDDQLFTPPVSDGVLPGVIRGFLVDSLGVTERSLSPSDIKSADGVMVTNSLRLLSPVRSVDDATLPVSPAFAQLQHFIFSAIRNDCGLDLVGSSYLYKSEGAT